MTNKEAKEIMSKVTFYWELGEQTLTQNQINEALDMAIKALEQQPNRCDSCIHSEEQDGSNCYECVKGIADNFEAQQTNADCISRQAVLDMATTIQTDDFSGNEIIEVVDVDDIKELPSVTPQQKIGHWILLDECSNSGYYCSECHKKVIKEGWSNTVKKVKYCPNCGERMAESEVQK